MGSWLTSLLGGFTSGYGSATGLTGLGWLGQKIGGVEGVASKWGQVGQQLGRLAASSRGDLPKLPTSQAQTEWPTPPQPYHQRRNRVFSSTFDLRQFLPKQGSSPWQI